MRKPVFLSALSTLCSIIICSQPFPRYSLPDTNGIGQYISRTMHRLQYSDPLEKTTVKILFYGQSITAQDWWKDVKEDVEERFPNAELIIENRAIPGFHSDLLWRPVYFDVLPFYPDLVLFHVYGSLEKYEQIIQTIRQYTTAEVLLQSSHVHSNSGWFDQMEKTEQPKLMEKYHIGQAKVRSEWQRYMQEHNITDTASLLKDNIHLNDSGLYLMSEIIKPYLYYKGYWPADTDNTIKYIGINPGDWDEDTLIIPVVGNRADIVMDNKAAFTNDKLAVFVDDHKPSEYPGTYKFTRPAHNNSCYVWCMPSFFYLRNNAPLLEENWTLTITEVSYDPIWLKFKLEGSKTGFDGTGTDTSDFVSNSGRVIIGKMDWYFNDTRKITGLTVEPPYEITFKTIVQAVDEFEPVPRTDSTENTVCLFQGIANTGHVLKLVYPGNKETIKGIRAYRPYFQRDSVLRVKAGFNKTTFSANGGTKEVTISSNTLRTIVYATEPWLVADTDTSYSSTFNLKIKVDANKGAERAG
ncbi:MAG: hypothetical protein HC896_18850 [Bacteroidales bacterium]|nr:hypothetical protein [Bacteroidales bacterium]